MSTAAQAVRPKQAPAPPEVRRREKPKHAMLSASPRYLRASIRLGGRHDPEEREAERAASTIVAGGCHRVPDPGGSTHLRATGADPPAARAASASMPAVADPGASGRVRRAATVDPGGSHSLRASPTSSASDVRPRAEPSAEPVRALHDPGGADHLRAAAAPPVIDPGASGRVRRSPAAQSRESEHVHPMMSAAAGDADAEAAHRIHIARGAPVRPLPATVRSRLEHGFGEPMASVHVDTSPAARAAAAAIGARAYTEGERITLGRGESEHDLGLMAHEATHVVQNRRAGHRGHGAATPSTEIRREIQAASDSDNDRTYRMLDGRTIELPDDMTAEEAHQLEMEGLAAKRRLGQGPPPVPVPDVRKPADKSKSKKAAVKVPHHGVAGPAGRHAHGPRSVGAVAKLHPQGGVVGRYLIAKAMPVLARGIAKLGVLSRHEQTHHNAGQKVHQAEKAVVIPPSEGQSKSNSGQVSAVAGRPAPAIDENKGKRELTQSLAENVPRTIEDVDNFKRDMKARHTGADVLKVVQTDKNAVVVTFGEMEHTPPPLPPEHPPVPLPPQEVAPPTAAMNLGQGTIAQLLSQHTDVSQYTKGADDRLREEGVTQEQLDMVDSGELAEANKEKKGLEKTAKTQPGAVQKFAQDAATQVDRDLQHEEKTERGALAARRRHGLNETGHQQKGAETALEKKRDEVAACINAKYQTAQDSVKKKLADLETQSMKRFDAGNARAAKTFEDDVHRELDAYKEDRYSGWFGWARKAKDWWHGMDDLPRVKEIFETNKAAFVQTINKLVEDISADNKRVVQECKDELTQARTDIKKYVDKLGPELKGIADKTAGEVNGKLDALDGFIRKKEEELQQKLADKQQAAIKAIDEKIEKMKEDMAGALSKLGRLLVKAAKKFFVWALEKFGYSLSDIESIIDKGIAVLKEIFTHPIQFVKHLIAAAKQGFFNFRDHFVDHLQDAVFDWLTGSLEGITLPDSWSLKGIASVGLQLIGLSWSHVRAKLVTRIPEPVVASMEEGFDLVVRLRKEGPMAAWEKLQEMGEDIKQAFIAGVTSFIEVQIVRKAIETIVAFFVPGAGIVRAIIGIYDTIVFFIQKAKQILEMIGNFLGSIGEIAAGNIGAAADALEKGLARALLLVINFLVRFLHLDGITAKIRVAIDKLRGKVDGALDRVADWVVDKGKSVIARLSGKKEGDKAKADETVASKEVKAKVRKDLSGRTEAGKAIVQVGVPGALHHPTEKPFSFMGRQHRLRAELRDGAVVVLVASREFKVFQRKLLTLRSHYAEKLSAGGHAGLLKPLDALISAAASEARHKGRGPENADLSEWLEEAGGSLQDLGEKIVATFGPPGKIPQDSLILVGEHDVYKVLNHGVLPDLLKESPGGALEFSLEAQRMSADGRPGPVRLFTYGDYYPPGPARMTGWTTYVDHPDGPYFVFGNEIRTTFRKEAFRPTFFAVGWRAEQESFKTREINDARQRAREPQFADRRNKWLSALPPAEQAAADPILIEMRAPGGKIVKCIMWDGRDTSRIALDHVEEVSRYWNREGHNMIQQRRVAFYYNTGNLQILDEPTNSSKGGPDVHPAVGPNFRGPLNRP